MLLFRLICAVLMAWGVNWAFSRAEAQAVIELVPDLAVVAPAAAAVIGAVNLAKRQGWGMIVAVVNGVWAGLLTLLTSILFYGAFVAGVTAQAQEERDGGIIAAEVAEKGEELIWALANPPFLAICIAATITVAIITEIVHWALVRILKPRRRRRPKQIGEI